MLVDLDLTGRRVMIVGGGSEAELKAVKLVDAGAKPVVVAARFTAELRRLSKTGSIKLIETSPALSEPIVKKFKPHVLFISTGKRALDSRLANIGRSFGGLVCVVDTPALNDFNMPAIARVGPVRIAISSEGRSPAMVKILRKRVERVIKPEDLLQIELQHGLRGKIAEAFKTHAARKRMVYEIIDDDTVAQALKKNDPAAARARALALIRNGRRSRGGS